MPTSRWSLLDLTCKAVADQIKGKSPEEIRVRFNIKNDFTPEEEQEVKRENMWCEERCDNALCFSRCSCFNLIEGGLEEVGWWVRSSRVD